jgi:hypothetical protein
MLRNVHWRGQDYGHQQFMKLWRDLAKAGYYVAIWSEGATWGCRMWTPAPERDGVSLGVTLSTSATGASAWDCLSKTMEILHPKEGEK